jgi:hypothetical protein
VPCFSCIAFSFSGSDVVDKAISQTKTTAFYAFGKAFRATRPGAIAINPALRALKTS